MVINGVLEKQANRNRFLVGKGVGGGGGASEEGAGLERDEVDQVALGRSHAVRKEVDERVEEMRPLSVRLVHIQKELRTFSSLLSLSLLRPDSTWISLSSGSMVALWVKPVIGTGKRKGGERIKVIKVASAALTGEEKQHHGLLQLTSFDELQK
ncbi:hypothetical protein EYF80_052313 [Liparis tanakae]|uniref:Uncharacterized protein n=1 Tax=Liparis tanakae TaxID=230148 RepID=A0A4Z2F8N4_9TELE|nr:hypothetical protein EYF80_052313 [Liparis tanakae]